MNPAGDRKIVQRLRAELGSLEISPAPVLTVTQRGTAIRARRRAAAVGASVAVLAVLAAAQVATRPAPPAGTVTIDQPNPRAPGGVFASGTADGAPWALAVRNIASPGSHRCLAAVMLNGRDGDVLFPLVPVDPTFGNPAILARVPGLPAVSAMFTQVTPAVTKTVTTFNAGGQITARPVRVRECGHTFHLVGFLYADSRRGIDGLSTSTPLGPDETLTISHLTGGHLRAGIWLNLDKSEQDLAASQQATVLGTGTVDGGKVWQIRSSLGLWGQCYTATLHGGGGRDSRCVPVAAPQRTMDLSYVPVPGPNVQFTGYAGLVSPRTARATARLSNGRTIAVVPVTVTGRAFIAFVVPPDYWVTRLSLADSAGRVFASVTRMPPPDEAGPVAILGGPPPTAVPAARGPGRHHPARSPGDGG